MPVDDFNDFYLNPLLEKLSKDNKLCFLMGDFNIDLLHYDSHPSTNEFLDTLASNHFLPHIIHPTRITSRSKTLIDNIFSNINSADFTSGNLTADISDHLPQFMIAKNILSPPHAPNVKVYERNWKVFNKVSFIDDFNNQNWDANLKLSEGDCNRSLEILLNSMNILLDKHAPFKKLTKQEIKFKEKPWITGSLKNSIHHKNRLFLQYINCKDPILKTVKHNKFKEYRNILKLLLKDSKKQYFNEFFKNNINNIKNTWKGIKDIINIKSKVNSQPNCIFHNNSNISDPKIIADSFNEYFSNVGKKIQSKIPVTNLKYDEYLDNPNPNSFFIQPTDPEEISSIISNLDLNKSCGPNSIPTRVLKLLNSNLYSF